MTCHSSHRSFRHCEAEGRSNPGAAHSSAVLLTLDRHGRKGGLAMTAPAPLSCKSPELTGQH